MTERITVMFKKSALAGITMIAAMSLSAPVMAATDVQETIPANPVSYSETVNAVNYSVTALDKTMYVTADMLNVRANPSTEGEIIGAFYYGDSVKVTGQADQNIDGLNWFRIDMNDGEGFVSAEFLSDTVPAPADPVVYAQTPADTNYYYGYTAPAAATYGTVPSGSTGTASNGGEIIKTSYVYAPDGTLIEINKYADGSWACSNGTGLTWISDYEAMTDGGEALMSYDPSGIPDLADYLQSVLEAEGYVY